MGKKKEFPYGNFFKMPNIILGNKKNPGWIQEIGPFGYLIYSLIIRRYDHKQSKGLYESHKSMASLLGITVPTLEKYLLQLIEMQLIDRVHSGKRKHDVWTYVPRLPVPCPEKVTATMRNTQSRRVIKTQTDLVKKERLPNLIGNNTQFHLKPQTHNSVKTKEDKVDSQGLNILFNRPYKNMSIKEKVKFVLENLDQIDLKTMTQVAWRYWCHIWEEHYGRPYYLAKTKSNSQIIPKDKKNLKDKISAVGFGEVITRMDRCIEICDEVFPCYQKGKWVQPITLNNFVNNHFFDKWILPNKESGGYDPMSSEDKLKAVEERRREQLKLKKKNKHV